MAINTKFILPLLLSGAMAFKATPVAECEGHSEKKRIVLVGESYGSLLVAQRIASHPGLKAHRVFMIYKDPNEKLLPARPLYNLPSLGLFTWLLQDKNKNPIHQIHHYKFFWERFLSLFNQKSGEGLKSFQESMASIVAKAPASETAIDWMALKAEVLAKFEKEEHLIHIKGTTEILYEFGNVVTQVEVNAKDFKQMKGDYFVLSNCPQNAHMFSSMFLKVPILKFSTPAGEKNDYLFKLNGPTSQLPFDRMPVIGRSSKFNNLYYNLGISPAYLPAGAGQEETEKSVIFANKATANLICSQLCEDLGVAQPPKTALQEEFEKKAAGLASPERFMM